jgi:hypothetical protein
MQQTTGKMKVRVVNDLGMVCSSADPAIPRPVIDHAAIPEFF